MADSYAYAGSRRVKPVSIVVGLILGSIALLTAFGLAKAGPSVWSSFAGASFQSQGSLKAVAASVWKGLSLSTLNPLYWAFVALLSILQWFWPARRDQRTFSVEMGVDAVWFVMGNALQLTVVAVTLGAVAVAFTEVVGTWSLNLQPVLGVWGLAIFAFVLSDLLAWASHWCHHKVGTLWRFHSVHHSQQRLNALSDNRTHVGEVVAAALIVFVPSKLLGLSASAAMGLAFVGIYYSAMLHSNIRTNLGPLKYVFMGPQPHRVHHSILPQHYEFNFGTVFPWWDYIAGTMYKGYDEYPPTGISDAHFPLRVHGDLNPWRWFLIFVKQLVYPFQGVLASFSHRDDRWRQLDQGWTTASDPAVGGSVGTPTLHGPNRRQHRTRTVVVDRLGIGSRVLPSPPASIEWMKWGLRSDAPHGLPPWHRRLAVSPPASWYDNPVGSGLRYWDGAAWTPHVVRVAGAARSQLQLAHRGQRGPSLSRPSDTAVVREDRRPRPPQTFGPTSRLAMSPPASWYGNPVGPGLRYWDGAVWTPHVVRVAGAARSQRQLSHRGLRSAVGYR